MFFLKSFKITIDIKRKGQTEKHLKQEKVEKTALCASSQIQQFVCGNLTCATFRAIMSIMHKDTF